jgi:hypothetical protein
MSTRIYGAVVEEEANILYVYKLHRIVLASNICLTKLSVALCLFMVFTGKCMTRFDLPANYH